MITALICMALMNLFGCQNESSIFVNSPPMVSPDSPSTAQNPQPAASPDVGVPNQDGVVVKARLVMNISSSSDPTVNPATPPNASELGSPSGTLPVSVINAPSTSMTVDTTQFAIPTITNTLLDFGYLNISALLDNNLNVCGTTGKVHCGTAIIRIYTTGQAGAGVYNSVDQFGAPLTAGISGSGMVAVGLTVSGAGILQSMTIPSTKHTVKLADFTPTPHYDVKADFTDAGQGTYATTIVLEYALAP